MRLERVWVNKKVLENRKGREGLDLGYRVLGIFRWELRGVGCVFRYVVVRMVFFIV